MISSVVPDPVHATQMRLELQQRRVRGMAVAVAVLVALLVAAGLYIGRQDANNRSLDGRLGRQNKTVATLVQQNATLIDTQRVNRCRSVVTGDEAAASDEIVEIIAKGLSNPVEEQAQTAALPAAIGALDLAKQRRTQINDICK